MDYTFAQWVLLFFIYAVLGWCVEVAFAACHEGKFVNRGFLNGPICPIYGFGVVGVVMLLAPVRESMALLFVGSVLITTLIELITGFLLKKIFHARWWDYSDMKWNIGGYICPLFSIMWGVACLIVVRWIHPLIYRGVTWLPSWLNILLDCVACAVIAVDIVATVAAILKLDQRLKLLTELAGEICDISDELGLAISDKTLIAQRRVKKQEARLSEFKEEAETRIEERRENSKRRLAALRERFSNLQDEHFFGQVRLMKAFPHMKNDRYQEALDSLRERLKKFADKKEK